MFRQENQLYKIIGRVFASFISVALVLLLIVAPVVTAARSLLTPETLIEVVKEAADDTVLEDVLGDVYEQLSEEQNVEKVKENLDAILDSETAHELLTLYFDDVTGALAGETDSQRFTAENVGDVLKEHKNEIVDLITAHTPDVSAQEIEDRIDTFVEERLPEMLESLPNPATLTSELDEVGVRLAGFFSGAVVGALWGAVAVLAILIFACRPFRFRFLKWLGIDTLVAALFLLPAALALRAGAIASLLAEVPMVTPILAQLASGLFTAVAVMAAVGVVLIGVNIALHFVFRRKFDEKPQQPAVPRTLEA